MKRAVCVLALMLCAGALAYADDALKPIVVSDIRSEIGAKETLVAEKASAEKETAEAASKKAVGAEQGYLAKELGGFRDKGSSSAQAPSSGAVIGRLIGALALIFVLMGTFAFVTKKFFMPQAGARGTKMKIVETLLLAPGRQMYVVDVFGSRIVVGSDQGGLKYFCTIDRSAEQERFKDELQRQVKQYSVDEPADDLSRDISDIHSLTERLRRMKEGI